MYLPWTSYQYAPCVLLPRAARRPGRAGPGVTLSGTCKSVQPKSVDNLSNTSPSSLFLPQVLLDDLDVQDLRKAVSASSQQEVAEVARLTGRRGQGVRVATVDNYQVRCNAHFRKCCHGCTLRACSQRCRETPPCMAVQVRR